MIDAHQHFWHYEARAFGWLRGELSGLRRDFLPADLRTAAAGEEAFGSVAVQAQANVAETAWLLRQAERHPWIRGVVGWLPLTDDGNLAAQVADLPAPARLVGLRQGLQGASAADFTEPARHRGLAQLPALGLTCDLLVSHRELPHLPAFVDRHPGLTFVLDHLAKPPIRDGGLEPWAAQLGELARRPNVTAKLSGLVTEAGPSWTPEQLRPWFEAALAAFGPERLLFGSDWPVCLGVATWACWLATARALVAPLAETQRAAIMGANARRVYRLDRGDGPAAAVDGRRGGP